MAAATAGPWHKSCAAAFSALPSLKTSVSATFPSLKNSGVCQLLRVSSLSVQGCASLSSCRRSRRCGGVRSHGFVVGHVCPEAQVGGSIALVEDGETVTADVIKRDMEVNLSSEEEWKKGRENGKPLL